MYCFPVLTFCFYLYVKLCLAREFTYCRVLGMLQVVVFVVLELTVVIWYLSAVAA